VALFGGQVRAVMLNDVFMGGQQEASCTTGRISDRIVRTGLDAVDHRRNQRTRCEVLSCTCLDVFGSLGQQFLVGIALDVSSLARPVLLVDQIDDEPLQFGWVLNPVLCLAEDDTQGARLTSEIIQRIAIRILKTLGLSIHQRLPPRSHTRE